MNDCTFYSVVFCIVVGEKCCRHAETELVNDVLVRGSFYFHSDVISFSEFGIFYCDGKLGEAVFTSFLYGEFFQ